MSYLPMLGLVAGFALVGCGGKGDDSGETAASMSAGQTQTGDDTTEGYPTDAGGEDYGGAEDDPFPQDTGELTTGPEPDTGDTEADSSSTGGSTGDTDGDTDATAGSDSGSSSGSGSGSGSGSTG